MKKILGLDIGTTSIGWAIVEADEKTDKQKETETLTDINNNRIGIYKDAVGVRIISQDTERFDKGLTLNDPKGSTLTLAANRRKYRGSRRMKSRYKLRRDKLNRVLSMLGMDSAKEYYTNEKGKRGYNNDIGKAIYNLRDRAIREKISLHELGRILLHLNQWRGYSSDRFAKEKKPKFEYLTGKITYLSDKPIQIDYEKNDKTKINWLHYSIEIKLDEPFKIDEDNSITEVKNARLFVKDENRLTFKQNDLIAFNFKKQDIKKNNKKTGVFNKISPTKVNPDDWNFKYQELHITLTEWCKTGGTVGSYFYHNYYENQKIDRIRNNVVNREWYENEFDKIWDLQLEKHKDFFEELNIEDVVKAAFKDYQAILNEINKKKGIKEQLRFLIKNKIIYFQRPWQQAKSKGRCSFEKIKVKKDVTIKGTGKKETFEEYIGRTVIPRSHPLYQDFRMWQKINNVKIFLNTPEQQKDLFNHPELFEKHIGKPINEVKDNLYNSLQNCKTKSWKTFCKDELGIKFIYDDEDDAKSKNKYYESIDEETGEVINAYFTVNFRKRKKDGSYDDIKLDGNKTMVSLQKILSDKDNIWFNLIHSVSNKQNISNLQLLWELIYDITNTDAKKVAGLIKKHFSFDDAVCMQLANIKFDDAGMGSLSAKAIRQILPLMNDGQNITEKTSKRIQSLIDLNNTEEEKIKDDGEKLESLKNFISDKKARIKLSKFNKADDFKYLNYWEAAAVVYGSHSTKKIEGKGKIEPVKQHSMNNPIVEKIVNETISIVNEIYNRYGFDEVRIELSRELKASMEERQQMWEAMSSNYEKNEWAKQMLRELKSDSEHSNSDLETSNKSNIEKIRIIEDVVKYKFQDEYKNKVKEYKLGEPTNAEIKKYLMWLEQNFRCPYTNQPIPLTDVFAKGKVVEIEHIIPRERYYLNSYANKVLTWKEVNQVKANNGNRTAYEFIVSKRVEETVKLGKVELPLVAKTNWEEHVKSMFPKGTKRNNLLRKEIPEDPINRTLNETQYINKKLKEKLAEIVGEQKVWVTSGAVTDILRDRWHLNEIMRELMRQRFVKFNTGENKNKLNLTYWTKQFNPKTGKDEDIEILEGYSKRLDHRHHAMDAIIIACTKQNHIQYINTLNAINNADTESDEAKRWKYKSLKNEICIGDSSKKFYTPWNKDTFIKDVKDQMNELIISHKNTRLLISPSKHRIDKDIKANKVASIRGELHKETNYAKKNYFDYINKEHTDINKLIPYLLKAKMENQNQTMVLIKSFKEIIKETVLKEKYQDVLISLFSNHDDEKLNKNLCNEISKSILKEIAVKKLLINSKTNEPLTWLSTYSEKDKSSRPNGLSMNLNDAKEIKDIADPRIKRLASYRLYYVNEKCKEIDDIKDIDKKEKDQQKAKIKALPLYSNAIYEVRVKKSKDKFEWVELKDFNWSDIDKIEYAKNTTTQIVKKKLKEVDFNGLQQTYFKKPIFISKTPILVKKVRQLGRYHKSLYEIAPKRYVQVEDVFMTYFFKEKNQQNKNSKREIKFLKFLDAARILNSEKPTKIDYTKLIEKEKTNDELQNGIEFELLFTLAKNDMVYLPENNLILEQINEIKWDDKPSILPFLYIVKEMNPSLNKIVFQHLHKADAIKISEADVKSLFKNTEPKEQKEEIKYGTVPMLQRCIKVFTDKLGKRVVPYWEFTNGCWEKQRAIALGLIPND